MSAPFPRGFLWGTATSAHQVEGGNDNDWTAHTRCAPAGAACDSWNRFEGDLDLARDLGTNAFRFSLEWSRIEPLPGQRDDAAIARYARLIEGCRERGLTPVVTLVQFTLPKWAEGGWLNDCTLEAFRAHVAFVAERFGDAVDTFITINEPNVAAGAGYVAGVFPPGKRFRPGLADRCQLALLRAHAQAFHTLHAKIDGVRVGASPHVVAWRPSAWDLGGFVRRAGQVFNWAFYDAIHSGSLRLDTLRADVPEAKGAADFMGMNYFMSMPAHLRGVLGFAGILRRPLGPGISDMGWPIDAAGFEESLLEAHRRYQQPILVTENGVADATDALRPDYLREHLAALGRALAAGADVRGYFHWSLLDNYEWHEGFAPRFGLCAVDYATQERTPRASYHLYRDLIAARTPRARETRRRAHAAV